jgi:type II secretory pathway pseudopilin PulG
MAVLALILALLLQVVNGIMQSTKTQSQQMDSVGTARRMLDVMESDLSQAVVGENTAILVNSNSAGLAFLTDRRSPSGSSDHRFLAVSYNLTTNAVLSRSYGSVGFTTARLLAAATNASAQSLLANGILGFQIRVVGDSTNYISTASAGSNWATNNYNGFSPPEGWSALITGSPAFASGLTNRAQSLQIWVAAIDEQNLQIVNSGASVTLGTDPSSWRADVDNSTLPAPVKSGIRILTKTIPLP